MPCKYCPHCAERKVAVPNPQITQIYQYGIRGDFETTRVQMNRFAINRLLKSHTEVEIKSAIDYAKKIRGVDYAPQVYSFPDLEHKWQKLREHYKKTKHPQTHSIPDDGKPTIVGWKDEIQDGVKVKVPIYSQSLNSSASDSFSASIS